MAVTFRTDLMANCTCPPGGCAEFVEPRSDCAFSRDGTLTMDPCGVCAGPGGHTTWHLDGTCLRCEAIAAALANSNNEGNDV